MENHLEQSITPESKEHVLNVDGAIDALEKSIEISPTLKDDVALCLIKPDAFDNRDYIVERLKASGLYIVKRVTKALPEDFVIEKMYGADKLPKPIAEATSRHFQSGPSEIILVKGDDVVQKLLHSIGLKTNPALCEEDTIRYIYGDHVPEELEGGLKYFRNAAHRPMNEKEAVDDLEKFKEII
jgi:nucleoside diphosphate kinase